jgi:hypothetical protein
MTLDSVDTLSLNREVLLSPETSAENKTIALLELEKRGLEFLCPIAKAIYLIETDRIDQVDALDALGSLWAIDDSEARGTGEYGDSFADVTEIVNHSIDISIGESQIKLEFASSSTMVLCDDFWPTYCRSACSLEWCQDIPLTPHGIVPRVFNALTSNAIQSQRSPNGYPTDSGAFIGTCTYSLIAINGLAVSGPTFSDSYHEQGWEGFNDAFPQRWDEEGDNGGDQSMFCWTHYLTQKQAKTLGIAKTGKAAYGKRYDYPGWLPKIFKENEDALWVHSDDIKSIYNSGVITIKPSTNAWVAIGGGSSWDPSEQDSIEDSLKYADWEKFPEKAPPLLRTEICIGAEYPPAELVALLPYMQKLFSLI